MPHVLLYWLIAGIVCDFLFLGQCYLMISGRAGKVIQANFHRENRFWGTGSAIMVPLVIGTVFWPYLAIGFVYFGKRVRQERARLREYGRL